MKTRLALALTLLLTVSAAATPPPPEALAGPAPFIVVVERVGDGPIIHPGMLPAEIGGNINGPSLIRVPDWVENPLGRYYLYFAHHRDDHIRMAYADDPEGPYTNHAGGVLHLAEQTALRDHIASPDVMVDEANRRLVMFYHGSNLVPGEPQMTAAVASEDGLSFRPLSEGTVERAYLRVFRHEGEWYGFNHGGVLGRAPELGAPFEPIGQFIGPEITLAVDPDRLGEPGATPAAERSPGGAGRYSIRHVGLDVYDGHLVVYFSFVGHRPERILATFVPMEGPPETWRARGIVEVAQPETAWEGADLSLEFSRGGIAREPVRQLRDPHVFREGEQAWLLYTAAGENALGLARLRYERNPNFIRRVTKHRKQTATPALAPGGGGGTLPDHLDLLRRLCDGLIAHQITDLGHAQYGALRCPSLNPQENPLHSRAGEAVYPLAVMYGETGEAKYRDAAIALGDWLVRIQQTDTGAWSEAWPREAAWLATTADQLISLAGALPMLATELSPAQQRAWTAAVTHAADWVTDNFPIGNINYWSTGAAGLRLAALAVPNPPAAWEDKAAELVALTLASTTPEGLIWGENGGVDLGYNLGQTLGFLALNGHLTGDAALLDRTAELLGPHLDFVLPNGAVDNSWGTRSYKWVYESGSKTAPGVHFTFALLADREPRAITAAGLARDWLDRSLDAEGLLPLGPHDGAPPCLYSSFARAQSLAMAWVYGPVEAWSGQGAPLPAQEPGWFRHYPSVNVVVVRTPTYMATVSANHLGLRTEPPPAAAPALRRGREYGRHLEPRSQRDAFLRGGSLSQLWWEGYGPHGFLQASSVTRYLRREALHLPIIETRLAPLTPQVEAVIDGQLFTNLYDGHVQLSAAQRDDHVEVSARGELRDSEGRSADVRFELTHRFYDDRLIKTYALVAPRGTEIRVIEPMVHDPALRVAEESPGRFRLETGSDRAWRVTASADHAHATTHGEDEALYWNPFPAVRAYPLTLTTRAVANTPVHITWELRAAPPLSDL